MGRGRLRRRAIAAASAAPWRGPNRRYDLLKEGTIAAVIVLALTLGLAGVLSSPDVPPVTVATWSRLAPADFLATAATELDGTSETATYGPPYNTTSGAAQKLLFSPQTWFGVTQPVDTAQELRPGAAGLARGRRPGHRRPAGHLPGGLPRPAAEVGQRLRHRRGQGEIRQRQPRSSPRPATGRSRR